MTTNSAKSSNDTVDETIHKSWLRTLDEIEGKDLSLVGGKAFRLAMLKQNGLNVLPGLVLTTTFFESHLKHSKLTPLWMGSPDIAVTAEALGWLADSLKTKPITRHLSQALTRQINGMFGPDIDKFAVRSSAIDEDQRDHTFAGIHLTELGVPRDALPIAITRCWASALSGPALEYRQVHGMSIQGIRIAVLIQPMLNPISSGVGFSLNPLTGSREELIIEATWGLGDVLVGGEVQPYFYKLANHPPHYPLLEHRSGHTPPPTPQQRAEPQRAEPQRAEPLFAHELTELALHLEQVQALMGEAQDVEWAKEGDTLFLLQTRPVVLPSKQSQPADPEWTRGSHPEYLPELPSPFFCSLLERNQRRAITFFQDLGLTVDHLGPYLKLILGRPYLNLTFLKRTISQVGIAPGKLLYTIGHTEQEGTGGALSIDWGLAFKNRQAYWAIFKRLFTNGRLLTDYQRLVDEAVDILEQANLDDTPANVLSQFRQHDRIYDELFNVNLGLVSTLSAVTAIGSSLMGRMPQNPATILTVLAQEKVQTSEGALNQALLALGSMLQTDLETKRYFREAGSNFVDYFDNPAISAEFKAKFDQLLAKFGERATYEADVGWPRYREDPASLLRIIQQYAQDEPWSALAQPKTKQTISWQQVAGQATGLERLLPWRRGVALPFIVLLRRLMTMRDRLNSNRARAMAAGRRWDLTLGKRWVKQGWLDHPSDIFWLTIEEVERTLITGQTVGVTLSSIIQARKETYDSYADTPMPFNLQESQIFDIQLGQGLSTSGDAEVITGLPISPGQVRGKILILQNPEDFQTPNKDIILVMRTTDPAWLPLLHRAAGLIVEMGGLLSHGSVIAREYGLPGVANIPDATSRFHNGDIVLIDGSTGVVQRLETTQLH